MNDFSAKISADGQKILFCSPEGRELQQLPIIQATNDHRPFILSTWVKSYQSTIRRQSFGGMRVPSDIYRSGESLVAEANWQNCLVVASEGDDYTIHAWVCGLPGKAQVFGTGEADGRPGYLWHVYVPPSLRHRGIGRLLVEKACGTSYMVSKPWPLGTQPYGHVCQYNPYMNGGK